MTDTNWQEFFDAHAPFYMDNCFVKNTEAEVAFLLQEFGLPPDSHFLEIGCGTGRHSVELARQGHRITGIDLSGGMLDEARRAAEAAGVSDRITFVQADATGYSPEAEAFDAAFCVCEGAFCLLGHDDDPLEHDLKILRHIAEGLKPGAPFLLTTLCAFRSIRGVKEEDASQESFDPLTLVNTITFEIETKDGPRTFTTRERHYVPTELALLCRMAGFTVEHIGGGTAGNWARRPVDLDEMELMLIARKK